MHRIALTALLAIWVVLAGCGPAGRARNATAPEGSPPTAVAQGTIDFSRTDPERVAAALSPVAELGDAAAQFAAAVGIAPEVVRVRVLAAGCTLCELEANQDNAGLDGLAVAEVGADLKAGDRLWLFVENLTCAYGYDNELFSPLGCQWAPM